VDEQRHEYLKVPEVAEVLRIVRSRAYELVGSGENPFGQDQSQRQGQPQGTRSLARRAAPAEREVEILEKINDCFVVSAIVREWDRSSRLCL
jgi:hypothetical protein